VALVGWPAMAMGNFKCQRACLAAAWPGGDGRMRQASSDSESESTPEVTVDHAKAVRALLDSEDRDGTRPGLPRLLTGAR
jgi:hypothetical protein